MSYSRIEYEKMKRIAEDVFLKFGYCREDSKIIANVILEADLRGIESHGVQRLNLYYRSIKQGKIKVNEQIEIIHETPVSAVIDAHEVAGQLSGYQAMQLAIKKAKNIGFGIAVTRNGNHYGIAGYYPGMAITEGLLGISMTNSEAIMPPTFGKRAMLGTNPIAVGINAKPYPFILDMATSVVPRGKTEVYVKKNQPMPLGWALDRYGKETQDAVEVNYAIKNKLFGGLLPLGGASETFGGHKGYGLALMVDIFTGIFAGGYTSNFTYGYSGPGIPLKNEVKVCSCFIAIDYGMLGDKSEIENRLSVYLQQIRDSEKVEGQSRIYTHGEKEAEARQDRLQNGILVNDATLAEVQKLCEELGIEGPVKIS
ncbi:MAG: Ldh family oxidoreductase [Bacillota bacterium]|jgi:LDH2 family malate/lactate/ureidoglycolate dehydrogenase